MNEKILTKSDLIYLNENVNIDEGCVVAVGSFDGVHLGHQKMLSALKKEAEGKKLPTAVFTFDCFDNPKSSKLLALPRKKQELLRENGVDIMLSAPFSALKSMEAEEFVNDILVDIMGAKTVVCGYDFRFGSQRKGNFELINSLGLETIIPSVFIDEDIPVSSTLVRSLVASGQLEKANRLLGRAFSFEGEIIHGAKLGRSLGFPTANQLYPENLAELPFGVYAVECKLDNQYYYGVANVGTKPTVSTENIPLCETYIFDYSGDCYGKNMEIGFLEFIRHEMRFSSVDELKTQIEKDKLSALSYLKKEYDI